MDATAAVTARTARHKSGVKRHIDLCRAAMPPRINLTRQAPSTVFTERRKAASRYHREAINRRSPRFAASIPALNARFINIRLPALWGDSVHGKPSRMTVKGWRHVRPDPGRGPRIYM